MKQKWVSLLTALGFAASQAEAKAETGKLEESDLDTMAIAVADRDKFKTQLDASLASEKKLQGELKSAQDALAALQADYKTAEEAKTKVEADLATAKADLATAKAALEGKGENPFVGNSGNDNPDLLKFKTSYDEEKYGI